MNIEDLLGSSMIGVSIGLRLWV